MKMLKKYPYSLLFATLLVLISAGVAVSFSNYWSTHFDGGNGDFSQWKEYEIGDCGGQNHSISGSQVHMTANYATDCFGAYYRENNSTPNAFPLNSDIRVMWQWRYPKYDLYGTQAGQLTSAYGVVQYYGMSGVDTKKVGGPDRDAHVLTDGEWGENTVDNPLWRSSDSDHNWHTSTFDFICDGRELTWWMDDKQLKRITNGTPRGNNDPYRPYQFWFGNLLTSVPDEGGWTSFDLDYVYVYKVERPQMNTPAAGSGGSQPVNWSGVPNTQQPDGSTWDIEYEAQACANSNCSTVIATAPWTGETTHTFTGLTPQQTYYYRVRARWVGTPALTTCWSSAVPAQMAGNPDLEVDKTAPAQAVVGSTIQYTVILRSTGEVSANGVVVTDPIPQYIINPTNISNGGMVQGNQIVWNLGAVNNGQSVTLTWSGTIDPGTPTSVTQIVNTALGRDNAGHTDDGTATTAVLKPVLELSKSAPAQVWPGGTIAYTITVRSTGNTALTNVVVRDPIPQYVTNPTNISNGGSVQGSTIVWNLGSLPTGQSLTLTWRGKIAVDIPKTKTEIENVVTATADGGLNKQAQAQSEVGFPEIGVAKTGPVEAAPGEVMDYVIAVHNTGSGPAASVVIRDPIASYILDPANISSGGRLENNEIVWTISTLNAGESTTVSWQGTVDPNIPVTQHSIVNTVIVCDSTGSCDTALVNTRILKPALSLVKNATSHVYPHGIVEYEIIVQNSGETRLTDIVVTDPLPQYVLNPRDISHNGVADASPFEGKIQVVWAVPELNPGETLVLIWRGTVDPATPDSEFAIRNVATVTTKQVNAQAEASSYVLHPRILLRKSATVMAGPGDNVLYTLTVENHSWAPAYGVEVHDPIPQYIVNQRNATEGGEVRAEEIFWYFGFLNPRESRTLMWEGTVEPTLPATVTQIANTAIAFDGMGHQDEAQAYTNMPGQSLYAYKTASYIVWPGGDIEYAITLQNFNQASLEQVVVRDIVPAYILYPRDFSHNGVFEGNTEVVWHIDSLAPGESVVLTWRGTVDSALPRTQDTLWNEAKLTSSGGLSATVRAKSYVDFPVLKLYKISTPAQIGPGEPISYTVMVENVSDVPALHLSVRDLIPATVLDPVRISDEGMIENIPAHQIVWTIEALRGGERRLLTWEGTVDIAPPASATQITNTVITQDLSGLTLQAQATTPILRPGLGFGKTAPAEIMPGQAVAYTLTLSNSGQTTLRAINIVDFIPEYISDPVHISHSGVISGSEIVWNIGDLLPGARIEVTWQGSLARDIPVTVDTLTNQALVTAWPGLQAVAIASSTVVKPNLVVVKTAPDGVRPGDIIDYRIEVINQGRTTLYGLEVTDPITSYLSPYQIGEGGYELPGSYITWGNLGDLAPGQSRSLSWRAKVDPNMPGQIKTLKNVAKVTGLGGLYLEGVALSAVLEAGLDLTKEAISTTHAGGEVSYTLHLINYGPGLARQVEVRDPIPGFVEYIPDSANHYGRLQPQKAELLWRFDQLQPGERYELTWRGQVKVNLPEGINAILNEAYATSLDEPGPITATATTTILEPVLAVEQNCPPFAQVGDVLHYQVSLQNIGGGTMVEVVARSPLTPALRYVPGSATAGGALSGSELIWNLGTLAAGATANLAFDLQIDPALSAEQVGSIVNFYSGNRAVSQSRCQTELTVPVLSLSKVAPAGAYVNDIVEYTLVLTNTSPVVAHHTVLTDVLSPGVNYVPGTVSDGGEVRSSQLIWRLGDLSPGQTITRRFKARVYIPPDFGDYDENDRARIFNEGFASADRALPVRAEAVIPVPRPVLTLTRTSLTNSKLGQAAVYAAVTTGESPSVMMMKYEVKGGIPVQADELAAASAVTSASGALVPAVQVVPGDIITYTLFGANSGPGVARQAVLKEWVPTGLMVLEETISHDGYYDAADHAVIWPLGDLAEGQEVRRVYGARVPEGMRPGSFEVDDNLAFMSSPDASTVYAKATTEITGSFRMTGLKSATRHTLPGGQIDYAIRVQNISPNLLDYIVIRDPLPDYTRYIAQSASLPPAFEDGGQTLVWNLGALASGEVREVRFSVKVASNLPDVIGRILNKAQVSFTGGETFELQAMTNLPVAQLDPTATPRSEDEDTDTDGGVTPVVTPLPGRPPVVPLPPIPSATPLPAPGLVKSVAPTSVQAGQTTAVTWRLTFTNPTPFLISGLTLRDLLPEGMAYVSSSTSRGTITVNQVPQAASGNVITWTVNSAPLANSGAVMLPTPVNLIRTNNPAASIPPVANLPQALNLPAAQGANSFAPTPTLTATSVVTPVMAQAVVTMPPRTELVANIGDVPPHSRVEIVISTTVISASRNLNYTNMATYSAANLDPGSSNEVKLGVEGNWLVTILPVTGGLLDLHTPQGQVTWGSVILLLVVTTIWWRRKRRTRL